MNPPSHSRSSTVQESALSYSEPVDPMMSATEGGCRGQTKAITMSLVDFIRAKQEEAELIRRIQEERDRW